METLKNRLIAFLKAKGLSQKRFEQAVGLSNGYVNNIRATIGAGTLQKILGTYPELNQEWLLTGEGTMMKESDEARTFVGEHGRRGIPLVTQYAQAGYLTGYGDPEYLESLPLVDFTPDREMTGNWLAFEVRGDSMDDGSWEALRAGDILVTREVAPHLWKDSKLHIHRRDFVLVCTEGILVKRIVGHDVERHVITIHSLNPDYDDREVDLATVHQIFSIVEFRRGRQR